MKFGIYVHSKRSKISPNDILKVVESAGVSYSNRDPDMAIVVGGAGHRKIAHSVQNRPKN